MKNEISTLISQFSEAFGVDLTMLESEASNLQGDTYITAFERGKNNSIKARLETMEPIKYSCLEEEKIMYLPTGDSIWVDISVIDKSALERAFTIFRKEVLEKDVFYLLKISYREKGNSSLKEENKAFISKQHLIHETMLIKEDGTKEKLKTKAITMTAAPNKKRITNQDKINSMSMEELAEASSEIF